LPCCRLNGSSLSSLETFLAGAMLGICRRRGNWTPSRSFALPSVEHRGCGLI
jgi:hypothetical protein